MTQKQLSENSVLPIKKIQSVLVFAPCYPPYIGGIANHGQEFTKALMVNGIDVTTFAPTFPWFQNPLPKDGTLIWYPACEPITNLPFPRIWSKEFWKMWRFLSTRTYDCVISRTRFFPSSLLAYIFVKQKKIPWIHIEHGSAHVKTRNPLITFIARFYDATIGKIIFKTADEVISISHAVHAFVSTYGRPQSPIIYRGLDLATYLTIPPSQELRKRYPKKTIIMWAGRMQKWKGVHLTIKALHMLPDYLKNTLIFVLIGDGPDRAYLEKLALGLPVCFLGKRSREQVIALFKESEIFIHSSLPGGGLSTSLLEAMFCKNAIIATPHEGAKEVIFNGSTGLLAEKTDSNIIASHLTTLLQDTTLQVRLHEEAYRYIVTHFSWDAKIQQYLQIFSDVIRKKNASHSK